MPSALLIIAYEQFQDVELAGTLKACAERGCRVTIASTSRGVCTGKYGGKITSSLALEDVDVSVFDSIAFIGGSGAAALRENKEALRIAREAVAAGKPLGAICIAPTILAAAGVLRGKRATVWDEEGTHIRFLEHQGAIYSKEAVTVDGSIVTANGASVAEAFGQALSSL